MDNKWISIQSFQRNQELINDINRLLIHYKLLNTGIDDRIRKEEVISSKENITNFLTKVSELVPKFHIKLNESFYGIDYKMKDFVQSFAEAKGSSRYKSILFKQNINGLSEMLATNDTLNKENIILSLSELRSLLEDQISIDSKEIFNDF